MARLRGPWGFALLALLAISLSPVDEAAAQSSLGQMNAMNGVAAVARGSSGGANVQQPLYLAPQQQTPRLGAFSSSSSAPASRQQAAATGLQASVAEPMSYSQALPTQGSSAMSGNPRQQAAVTGGQSSADMSMVHQRVAENVPQLSAVSGAAEGFAASNCTSSAQAASEEQPATGQSAVCTQSMSATAPIRQQAGLATPQDTSLAAAPTEDGSTQQALLKAAVLGPRKALSRDAQPAPKTASQEAMQAEVKSAALQSDTLKASALAAEVSSAQQGAAPAKGVVLLIHGGAQGGWVWSYPNEGAPGGVQGLLEDAGYLVFAPTLPYHEPNTQWTPNQGELKAQDYVDYLKAFMEQEAISGAVVVGHSVSGVWLQLLTVQAAERISRVVFLDAIVLKNGESFVSNAVGPAQLFFTLVFTYPSFPQSLTLATGQVDLEVWKNVMITLEGKSNATFARDTYTRLVPEPAGPQLEYLDFTAFYDLPMPKFFLFEEDDVSLLSGNNARWLDFAGRLSEANNGYGMAQTIKIRGDHQGMLTRPSSIAEGIIEAATRPLVNL